MVSWLIIVQPYQQHKQMYCACTLCGPKLPVDLHEEQRPCRLFLITSKVSQQNSIKIRNLVNIDFIVTNSVSIITQDFVEKESQPKSFSSLPTLFCCGIHHDHNTELKPTRLWGWSWDSECDTHTRTHGPVRASVKELLPSLSFLISSNNLLFLSFSLSFLHGLRSHLPGISAQVVTAPISPNHMSCISSQKNTSPSLHSSAPSDSLIHAESLRFSERKGFSISLLMGMCSHEPLKWLQAYRGWL